MMVIEHIFTFFWCVAFTNLSVYAAKPKKVQLSYPVSLLDPIIGSTFTANVSKDWLTCFGNEDYEPPTYQDGLVCMASLFIPFEYNCDSIWGSRSVVVESRGSIEFVKVSSLPTESRFAEYVAINVTRWLELTDIDTANLQREVKQVPAEPLYLCARSTDWDTHADVSFTASFRTVYPRLSDRDLCQQKALIHILLVIVVSSMWLLPYIAATVMFGFAYNHALKYFIRIAALSFFFIFLTPFMLTKKNRHHARLYLQYFFSRVKVEEAKVVIRKRWPVFQALYFSSVFVCLGSAVSYGMFLYCEGVDREIRNVLLRITLSIGASWFTFFLCRSFARFFRNWAWVGMAISLSHIMESHLNPMSRDEIVVATLVITFFIRLFLPQVAAMSGLNDMVLKVLPNNTIVEMVLKKLFRIRRKRTLSGNDIKILRNVGSNVSINSGSGAGTPKKRISSPKAKANQRLAEIDAQLSAVLTDLDASHSPVGNPLSECVSPTKGAARDAKLQASPKMSPSRMPPPPQTYSPPHGAGIARINSADSDPSNHSINSHPSRSRSVSIEESANTYTEVTYMTPYNNSGSNSPVLAGTTEASKTKIEDDDDDDDDVDNDVDNDDDDDDDDDDEDDDGDDDDDDDDDDDSTEEDDYDDGNTG